MTDANSETTFEQTDATSLPTGYLPPTAAAWVELPADNDQGNGNESVMGLLGLLSRCTSAGMDPRMRALAGKAFRDAKIAGIMVQITPGATDADFTVQTHVMRQEEAAPCAGE